MPAADAGRGRDTRAPGHTECPHSLGASFPGVRGLREQGARQQPHCARKGVWPPHSLKDESGAPSWPGGSETTAGDAEVRPSAELSYCSTTRWNVSAEDSPRSSKWGTIPPRLVDGQPGAPRGAVGCRPRTFFLIPQLSHQPPSDAAHSVLGAHDCQGSQATSLPAPLRVSPSVPRSVSLPPPTA